MAQHSKRMNSDEFQRLKKSHDETLARDMKRQDTIVKTKVAQKVAEAKIAKADKSSEPKNR